MDRYAIEDEPWFEAGRVALERRAFRLRVQPRSIVIEKDGRLPRLVGSAREFLEFLERQGMVVDAAAYAAAARYGDGSRSAPFDAPGGDGMAGGAAAEPVGRAALAELARGQGGAGAGAGAGAAAAAEARLAELRAAQERVAAERRAAAETMAAAEQLAARCAGLEAELVRARADLAEAAQQRDLYQMSVAATEARMRAMQAELDGPADQRGPDKKFNALRRYLARELHPDLAGEDDGERRWREAIFKRVWAKIEQLQ